MHLRKFMGPKTARIHTGVSWQVAEAGGQLLLLLLVLVVQAKYGHQGYRVSLRWVKCNVVCCVWMSIQSLLLLLLLLQPTCLVGCLPWQGCK
jgi:hypothetical protein